MNPLIARFGQIVGNTIDRKPQKALTLLKAAYKVSGWQMAYLPDKRLSPAHKYLAVICNQAIQQPLRQPQRSAVVNVFLPCHILQAMNILPQFTEGLACYLNGAGSERAFIEIAEINGTPKSYCSYHKILIGAALSNVLPKPRFVVNTTLACDANISTFRLLAEHYDVPHFTIDIPNTNNEHNISYVASQLEEMTAFIEDIMQEKLDPDKLRESIRTHNRSIRLYHEYYKELREKFLVSNLTSEMYNIFVTHILLGTPQAERYFQLLLEDTKKAPKVQEQLRLLWLHTMPFWQESVKDIFNFSERYQLLCSDLNFDIFCEIPEDDPYYGMARKLLNNAMGGTIERRAENALKIAHDLQADGAIYFNHWGCKNTLGGAQFTKKLLQEAGVPTLVIDGDGCDRNNSNDGQIKTRVQAFLEMLEGKND